MKPDPMSRPESGNRKQTSGITPDRHQSLGGAGANLHDLPALESGYSPHQEIRGVLQALHRKLNRALGAIESEIGRVKRNYAVVQRQKEEINSEEVIPFYQQAEEELAQKFDHYLSMREDLSQQVLGMDQAVQAVLDELGVEDDTRQSQRMPVQQSSTTPKSSSDQPSSPKPPTRRTSVNKKKDDGFSEEALAQHAAAMFGLSPKTVNKAAKKSKDSNG